MKKPTKAYLITIKFQTYTSPNQEQSDGYTVSHLIHVFKSIDDVVGQTRQQVYDEPGLQVIHPDQLRIRDHLPSRPDKRGVEVEHNVHEEDDVHNAVQNQPGDVILFGLEGDVIRNHDGSVEGQDEDDPVPGGLKGAVV